MEHYESNGDWKKFVKWCEERRLKPLPAHPWTVAVYIRWCEPRINFQKIIKCLKSITRMHLLKCYKTPERDPLIIKIIQQLELRSFNAKTRVELFRVEDFAVPLKENNLKMNQKISSFSCYEELDKYKATGNELKYKQVSKRFMQNSPRLVRRYKGINMN